MKNITYILFFLPLISFAVELHPQEECEDLKHSLSTNVVDLQSIVNNDIYSQVYSLQTISNLIDWDINSFRSLGDSNLDLHPNVAQAYYNCADSYDINLARSIASNSFSTVETSFVEANNKLSSLRFTINGINCSECSVSNTNCCDFSEIIEWLDRIAGEVNEINYETRAIYQLMTAYYQRFSDRLFYIDSAIRNGFLGATNLLWTLDVDVDNGFDCVTNLLTRQISLLTGNNLALVRGFGNATNLLQSIYDVNSSRWGISTNFVNLMYYTSGEEYDSYWKYSSPQVLTTLSYPSYLSGNFNRFFNSLGYFNNTDWTYSAYSYGLAPTYFLMLQEIIGGMYAQNSWTQYQHDYMYPPITNSLTQIYIETTNFFSFFRDEIGVQGVLASWTPERGTYYDYLTNHYLSVVMGDRLSAEFSANTNWFSRIESLLAALVFADGVSTNTVSTSSYQSEQTQLRESARAIQSISQNHMSIVREDVGDILELYQSYVNMYDNITMPQRIVLFTLSNQTDTDTDVVSFSMDDNPGLVSFVEGCRAVTTFCWASVGIFCLLRFVFWAAKGVYYACKFIFSVISSIFK